MATTKIATYPYEEVCEMLGIGRVPGLELIKKGKFPFPVIQVDKNKYVVPRKAVEKTLKEGNGGDLTEITRSRRGKKKKWVKGEYIHWNFPIPNDLAEAFNYIVDKMNESLAAPLSYTDARLLAVQEFIERRPIEE